MFFVLTLVASCRAFFEKTQPRKLAIDCSLMDVLLVTTDLMVTSRVTGTATQFGVQVVTATNTEQVIGRYREVAARLILIDLSTPSLDLSFVQHIKGDAACNTRVAAFGPHVHEQRLAAARAAGCDDVMSRGRFFSELATLMQEIANSRAC